MSRALRALSRHWAITALLAAGLALRVLAWIAYQPALFYSDSVNYLSNTGKLPGTGWHPPGYPVVLDLLTLGRHLAPVSAVQHLLVLADAGVLYAVLLRLGCGRPAASLACVPVLVDAYQVQIEQYVMAEAVFETLLVAAVAVALWSPRPGARRIAVVGLLLSLSALVRLDAAGMIVPLAGWAAWTAARARRDGRDQVVLRRHAPLAVGVAVVAFGLPLAALVGLRAAAGSGATASGSDAIWLYGRVAPFADCAADDVPAPLRPLCPAQPADRRPGPIWFENSADSPARRWLAARPGDTAAVTAFAHRVALHQPFDYLHAVLAEFAEQFRPTRAQIPGGPDVRPWRFRTTLAPVDPTKPVAQSVVDRWGTGRARIDVPVARWLGGYQRYGYLPGPLVAAGLLAGAVVLVRRRRHRLAPALWLLLSAGVMAVLVATATVLFSWRYVLPTLLLYPPAAAVAWTMLRSP
jgi:hypothetical protein